MKKIAIIKCGETYPTTKAEFGDFEDWIIKATNLPENLFSIYNMPKGEVIRHPDQFLGGIITGSHAMVSDNEKWMKTLKDWIITARYSNIPVLGICFGHQIMAEALGGKVGNNAKGIALGTVEINFTSQGKTQTLFKGLGDSIESFAAHSQCVTQLPQDAELLAYGERSSIEAFRLGKLYGVQFHPEFDEKIMKSYAMNQNEVNPQRIKTKVRFEYRNQKVLSNFLDICVKF